MPKRLRYTIETLLVNALILSTFYQLLVYLANRRFWRRTLDPPAHADPSISAVVPLYGKSLDTLALLHVIAVTRPTPDYDVVLVVESTHDSAYATAQDTAAGYPDSVRVVISGDPGTYNPRLHALNAGWQQAQGDLVAFIDPDVYLREDMWFAALSMLEDPALGAVFAPPLIREPDPRSATGPATGGEMLTALHINHARTAGLPFAAISDRVPAMASGFMVLRREVLERAGGMLHLLDQAADDQALSRLVIESGAGIAALPVPARKIPAPETFNEATEHLSRILITSRVYNPRDFFVWLFTNPLTVGFALGWITEREGRWWGRRTWWFFTWLRLALAYELDRIRFGQAFHWTAYPQLFMLDTFIAPALWLQATYRRTFTWRGRTYRIHPGGAITRIDQDHDPKDA